MPNKITPFLWFENNLTEAIDFYKSIFKKIEILNVVHYGDAGPGPKGDVMTATFVIEGQTFMALNGNPMFKFTEAISFMVNCETQQEIDHFWEKLSAGGEKSRCGWLKDKFGLSWQIVPSLLINLHKGNAQISNKVMQAMMKMDKLDIAELERASKS